MFHELVSGTEFKDCRKKSIYILEAFRLTLFKRIRQKYIEYHFYRDTVDERKKKKKRLDRDW